MGRRWLGWVVVLVLVCPLFGVVVPGVGDPIWQTAFSLFDVVDEGSEVGAAPTTGGYCAGSSKSNLLAAAALKGNVGIVPLVDFAKGHFATLVVRFDALGNPRHRGLPLPAARRIQR